MSTNYATVSLVTVHASRCKLAVRFVDASLSRPLAIQQPVKPLS